MPHRLSAGGEGDQKKARDPAELLGVLSAFTRTDTLEKHDTGYLYTEGVKYLADNAGAYWLLDEIFSRQKRCRRDRQLREFQTWVLTVKKSVGVLQCLRDVADVAFTFRIAFTEFPLPEIKLFLAGDILMLPSEY